MAGALKEEQRVRHVYATLQAVSCPLVEGLNLQEADSMLELLCVPSQHRTNILAWICSSINPNFGSSKRSNDPDVLPKEIAVLGQELMLCRADDLDLIIEGNASVHRQIQFLEQLLSLVPGCKKSAEPKMDVEVLLNELFAAENLHQLTQMLKPTLDPWPAHIKTLQKGTKSSSKPNREEAADVAALLQLTQSALDHLQSEVMPAPSQGTKSSSKPNREEVADVAALLQMTQSALDQLQSECEFVNDEAQSPGVFAPSSLRVAACDLQQLMATFSHVFETDLRAYCSRDPPSFSTEIDIFQRVHQLLLAFITELEILKEVSEASVSINNEVNKLQTQPRYQSRGEKNTLQDQLEELTRRIKDFFSVLHP